MTHFHSLTGLSAIGPAGESLLKRIVLGLGAMRQRRRLASLDDAMLRDIGLTREAARAEAERPIWDVPQSWLR